MPQYNDTDDDNSSDEDRVRVRETSAATNDIDNDYFQQISIDHNDNDSSPLEAVFADNTDEQRFSDTLTTIEVSLVTEKSSEIPYNPSSSSSLLATSAALNSLPLSRESQSKPVSSSFSSTVAIPDTTVSTRITSDINDDANLNTSLQVQSANVNRNSIESTIDTVVSTGIVTSDAASTMETSAIIPITTTSLDLGSEFAFSSSIKNDKIVDTDTNTSAKASPSVPEIEPKGVRSSSRKKVADLDSDSDDVSDDERSIPIPISYVSVSQMSGEIVATKGEPSVNLSAFSVEMPNDGTNRKAVKFDESTDKLTMVTSAVAVDRHAEKSRDDLNDLKWHLADQPKVKLIVLCMYIPKY